MVDVKENAVKLDIRGAAVAMIISAFGFVAALFWRDAIQAMINELVPEGQGLTYNFVAAIIVTVIAVIAIFIISKYMTFSEHIEKKVKKGFGKVVK